MIKIEFCKSENKAVAYYGNIKVGECNFTEIENGWNITHTEVNSDYQGQGIARKLVENIIENAKDCNKDILASCSYAKKVIEGK